MPHSNLHQFERFNRRHMLRGLAVACGGSLACRSVHAANWPTQWQANTLRFHADFPLRQDATLVRDTVNLHRSIPHALAMNASDELIYLFLFSNKRTYGEYLKHYFPGVPDRRALFIKQQGRGMVFAYHSNELAVDLRHETTHAVLHTLLPMVPLWLDEGLAEYFEVRTSQRYSGNPHLKPVQRNVRWRRPASLAKLESKQQLEQMDREQYRDAWSWVHFLLHGPPEINHEFRLYLSDIHHHTPPGQLSRRLENRMPDVSRAYAEHFLHLQR